MSVPNLPNNIIQQQNIVINQVPLSHTIMTNVNATNGIPVVNAMQHTNSNDHASEMKTSNITVVETITGEFYYLIDQKCIIYGLLSLQHQMW